MKTLDVILVELHRQAREDPRLYVNDSNPFSLDVAGHINLPALAAVIDEFHQPKPPVAASADYLREVRAA